MIEDKVDKLQNSIEGNQEAELDYAHSSDVSEFYSLEEFEELNYKAMPYMERKFRTSNSDGISITNPRL